MRKIIAFARISEGDYSLSQGSVNVLNSLALLSLKQQRCDQAMRPINRTLEVLYREESVHDISWLFREVYSDF